MQESAFAEEKEWRIINTSVALYDSFEQTMRYRGHVSEIAFRVSRTDVVPYSVLHFDPPEIEDLSPFPKSFLDRETGRDKGMTRQGCS